MRDVDHRERLLPYHEPGQIRRGDHVKTRRNLVRIRHMRCRTWPESERTPDTLAIGRSRAIEADPLTNVLYFSSRPNFAQAAPRTERATIQPAPRKRAEPRLRWR